MLECNKIYLCCIREKEQIRWWSMFILLLVFYLKIALVSVSYTHLDVYKRQILRYVGKLGAAGDIADGPYAGHRRTHIPVNGYQMCIRDRLQAYQRECS